MNRYKVTDAAGTKYTYEATDMRMALVVHHQCWGTEVVKAKLASAAEEPDEVWEWKNQ